MLMNLKKSNNNNDSDNLLRITMTIDTTVSIGNYKND